MGLDMYLNCNDKDLVFEVQDKTMYRRWGAIIYWRKANAIHKWFLENTEWQPDQDDCKPFTVTVDDLRNLRDVLDEVLKNPEDAPDILPTRDGFFFGSTEYDDWYFENVKRTKETLDEIISKIKYTKGTNGLAAIEYPYYSDEDWEVQFQYEASW